MVAPKRSAQAASHRYVEVGTYGDANAARSAIARLQQMGLPVRTGHYQRKGRTLQIVLAGPFQTQAQLQNGLAKSRSAGFGNARPRN